MSPRKISLHIEELVLHGFNPTDRYAIAAAVEQALTQRLADQIAKPRLEEHFSQSAHRQSIDAGTFPVRGNASASSIGAQIAHALHGGIRR